MVPRAARLAAPLLLAAACAGRAADPAPGAPPAGVTFARAETRTLTDTVRLLGEVARPPGAEIPVLAPAPGVVMEVADAGTLVARGGLLARLEPAFAPTPETLLRLDQARARARDLAELAGQGLVAPVAAAQARQEHDRLRAAVVERQADRRLAAPCAGVVVAVAAHRGQAVERGQELLRLADPERLEVRVRVPEPFAGGIRPGMPATVMAAALPGRTLGAAVDRVAAASEPSTRTVEAAFTLASGLLGLRPGMGAVVALPSGPARSAVTVPRAAVLARPGGPIVVVRGARGVEARPVVLGEREGDRVAVRSGLAAGEEVAVGGAELLVAPPEGVLPDAVGPRSWLVVPAGRGRTLAAALPELPAAARAAVAVRLDARAMAMAGLRLGDTLEAIAGGRAPAAEAVEVAAPAEGVPALRWRRGAAAEPVDALLVAAEPGDALLRAARAADPGADLIGAAADGEGRSPWLLGAGALVLLLALGSLRGMVLVAAFVLLLSTFAATPLARGLGAATLAAAAVATLARGIGDEGARLRLGEPLRGAALAAVLALIPALLVGRSDLPYLAGAAGAALATSLLLAIALQAMPSSASFAQAPLQRLPVTLAAVLLGGSGALALAVLPAAASAIRMPVGGALGLKAAACRDGIEEVARRALAAGAESVLLLPDAEGGLELVLRGPGAAALARELAATSAPGLGLGLARADASDGLLDREPLVGTAVSASEARLAAALAGGGARHDHLALRLTDVTDLDLLPLGAAPAAPVFLGEWLPPGGPPPPTAPRRLIRVTASGRDGARLALGAGLGAIAVGVVAVVLELRRGASGRRAREAAVGPVARLAGASVGAAALAAVGVEPGRTAAALLLAWAAALVAPLLATFVHSRPKSLRRISPASPGRVLP